MTNGRHVRERIEALPPGRVTEIEDVVAFIAAREQQRGLVPSAVAARVPAFVAVWDDPDDDICYDTNQPGD
jgi:hypothetical protein